MPILTVSKSYANGLALTEDMLDDARDSVHTFFNTTKLDEDNFQDESISTALLANTSVTAEKIGTSAIASSDFNANAVTVSKLQSVGQATGDDDGNDLITLTLTTTGRPVFLAIISDAEVSGGAAEISSATTTTTSDLTVTFARDGATLAVYGTKWVNPAATTTDGKIWLPAGWKHVDLTAAAGSRVYTATLASSPSSESFSNCRLIAYEL